jgi:hypothetical protein
MPMVIMKIKIMNSNLTNLLSNATKEKKMIKLDQDSIILTQI